MKFLDLCLMVATAAAEDYTTCDFNGQPEGTPWGNLEMLMIQDVTDQQVCIDTVEALENFLTLDICLMGYVDPDDSSLMCAYVTATSAIDVPDIRIEKINEDGSVEFGHAWVAGEKMDDIIEEEAPVEEEVEDEDEDDEDDLSTRMAASAFALAGLAIVNL
jgi:hypothetical protein